MIHDKYKAIFIHVPHTGGSTITKMLGKELKYKKIYKHAKPENYKKQFPEQWKNYYKFSIVRNPWDMLVSGWSHYPIRLYMQVKKLKNKNRIDKEDFNNFCILRREQINSDKFYTTIKKDFIDWVKLWIKVVDIKTIKNSQFTSWFKNGVLNYIIRFEDYTDGLNVVCNNIGFDLKEIPVVNSSIRRSYKDYYDEEIKQIIANIYKDDIEKFKYEF